MPINSNFRKITLRTEKCLRRVLTKQTATCRSTLIGGAVMFCFAAGVIGALGWKLSDPGVDRRGG
jgi:hypothetical protein